jgi:hypothetical protein
MSDTHEWDPAGLGRRARPEADARRRHQERMTVIRFVPGEYETVLRALESVATDPELYGQPFQQDAYRTWARLLVEGGHINPEQLRMLEASYGPGKVHHR